VTPFTVLTTAYLILLAEITGQTDIVIGTTAAGRPVPEASEVVGVFVNPLPVRFEVDPEQSVEAVLTLVRDRLLEFHQHQAYWLEDVVRDVDTFVGFDQNDTFRNYILLQNYWRPVPFVGPLAYQQVKPHGIVEHRLMRDVELVIDAHRSGWTLELWYRRAKYSPERADGWLRRYCELLRVLAPEGVTTGRQAGVGPPVVR
jgi:non-ribosomal peptide synthetase component F